MPGAASTQIACSGTQALASACPAATNVRQGVLTGADQVTFYGIDLPSIPPLPPLSQIVFRVVNLRVDTNGAPFEIHAAISTTGDAMVIANPTLIAAFVEGTDGLNASLLMPDLVTPVGGGIALSQCVPVNRDLSLDPTFPSASDGVSFVVRISEPFGTSFKNLSTVAAPPPDVNSRPPASAQNTPGAIYDMETYFYNPAFPALDGLPLAGLATQGTRFMVRFNSRPEACRSMRPYTKGKRYINQPRATGSFRVRWRFGDIFPPRSPFLPEHLLHADPVVRV